ncbi:NAD-dependent epimerase/dehydratase family protein [Leisingera sp. ANG59]|nr:NAD-dependent epimerase/dehydratase family protein [Leisingera sp. ANG59]
MTLPRGNKRVTHTPVKPCLPLRRTVLVTGGAGFLGSQLCARKLQQGHQVICLDNLQTGRMRNITPLMSHRSFRFIEHDVITPYQLKGPVHQIFNLACPASPPKYQLDPIHTFKTSVMGAMNALELAREKGAKVFQASTSEIYGDPEISPQPEGYRGCVNTFGPRACYDEGKRAAETLFHDYHHRYGVQIAIARIFNTYGPFMDPQDGRVVSNFINQALRGKDITVYGSGGQTRSFCYSGDLLDAIEALMDLNEAAPAPVNLGNPGEFTVLELARKVCTLTGTRSQVVFKDLPQDDPKQRKPDISVARSKLGWQPKVRLEDGLHRTIRHFQAEMAEAGHLTAAAR